MRDLLVHSDTSLLVFLEEFCELLIVLELLFFHRNYFVDVILEIFKIVHQHLLLLYKFVDLLLQLLCYPLAYVGVSFDANFGPVVIQYDIGVRSGE